MHDLAVIGSGPAGYHAALKAAGMGKKVCIIEKDLLGGTCLNKGCIPTKFMVHSAELFSNIKKAENFGIETESVKFNMPKMLASKDAVILKLRNGLQSLIKSAKIDIVIGEAVLADKNTVKVSDKVIKASQILIATGSKPTSAGNLKFDNINILSSADILNLNKIPQSLLIVGAGYIGCEFACIFAELGAKITMVELEPQILPLQDKEISRRLMQYLKKRGIDIILNTKISNIASDSDKIKAVLENGNTLEAEKALLTIGRRPNTEGLGLEAVGVDINQKGSINVDDNLKTSIDNIYAAGDVAGNYFLAYTAVLEAEAAVDNIFNKSSKIRYGAMPGCIFTNPQLAFVGLNEEDARQKGYDIKKILHSFAVSGKAQIIGQTDGVIKLIIDVKTEKILGAFILGPQATEIISELVIAIEKDMTVSELASIVHPHPTLYEAIHDTLKKAKE